MATLVLTAIGDDHVGLVRSLAGAVAEHGGNWETSRMAHLAGKFAGIVMVSIADESVDALIRDLKPLGEQGLLDVVAELSSVPARYDQHPQVELELVGRDRPGIVRDVSDVLTRCGANIEELESETVGSGTNGRMLFKARASLSLPDAVSVGYLAETLEDLGERLGLQIRVKST
jgi:glycine cleavage system regulatory protein